MRPHAAPHSASSKGGGRKRELHAACAAAAPACILRPLSHLVWRELVHAQHLVPLALPPRDGQLRQPHPCRRAGGRRAGAGLVAAALPPSLRPAPAISPPPGRPLPHRPPGAARWQGAAQPRSSAQGRPMAEPRQSLHIIHTVPCSIAQYRALPPHPAPNAGTPAAPPGRRAR